MNGGRCEGAGRFNDGRDGMNADTGQYQSAQVNEMWDFYSMGAAEGSSPVPISPSSPSGLTVIR